MRNYRADSIIAVGHAIPTVIKIDVDGFEDEVFGGMTSALGLPSLKTVYVEVHFHALNWLRDAIWKEDNLSSHTGNSPR